MKTILAVLLVFGLTILRARAEEADASFKHAVAQLYKGWVQANAFTLAYEVLEKETSDGEQKEQASQMRLTIDPVSGRCIAEVNRSRGALCRFGGYYYYRGGGEKTLMGSNFIKRPTSLVDVPLGKPLCDSLTLTRGDVIWGPVFCLKQAVGLFIKEQNMEIYLETLLNDPKSKMETAPGAASHEIVATLDRDRIDFDAALGVPKAFEITTSTEQIQWRVARFADKLPAEMSLTIVRSGNSSRWEATYKAIEGQCRRMDREEFDRLFNAPMPEGVEVHDWTLPPPFDTAPVQRLRKKVVPKPDEAPAQPGAAPDSPKPVR